MHLDVFYHFGQKNPSCGKPNVLSMHMWPKSSWHANTILCLKDSGSTNCAIGWSCPFSVAFLYNSPPFIIRSFWNFNNTFILEGVPSLTTYWRSTLLLIRVITRPMSGLACCSIFQSCLENFMVPSVTRLLVTTEVACGEILGTELSPLHPLLIIALTITASKVCNIPSYSQGILESASTSMLSLPLL